MTIGLTFNTPEIRLQNDLKHNSAFLTGLPPPPPQASPLKRVVALLTPFAPMCPTKSLAKPQGDSGRPIPLASDLLDQIRDLSSHPYGRPTEAVAASALAQFLQLDKLREDDVSLDEPQGRNGTFPNRRWDLPNEASDGFAWVVPPPPANSFAFPPVAFIQAAPAARAPDSDLASRPLRSSLSPSTSLLKRPSLVAPSLQKAPLKRPRPEADSLLSPVDYRWAAIKGFYNLHSKRWVKEKGGLAEYLHQRRTRKNDPSPCLSHPPVSQRAQPPLQEPCRGDTCEQIDVQYVWYKFSIPPELWVETDLFAVPVD
jgi:hypothetical protein